MEQGTWLALTQLVEHANKLTQYGFTQHAIEAGLGFHAARDAEGGWEIEFALPDDKERDATLLTFRRFLLRREAYSFHNFERIASDTGLTMGFRNGLIRIRQSFLAYLSGHPSQIEVGFFEEGVAPTRGEILDTVLNAAFFHTDESPKRGRYQNWCRDDIRASILHQAFTRIVVTVLELIEQAAVLARNELAPPGNENVAA